MIISDCSKLSEYKEYYEKIVSGLIKNSQLGLQEDVVAKTIYKVATDEKRKLRYPTAKMKNLIFICKMLTLEIYHRLVNLSFGD